MEPNRQFTYGENGEMIEFQFDLWIALIGVWHILEVLIYGINVIILRSLDKLNSLGTSNLILDEYLKELVFGYLILAFLTGVMLVSFYKKRESYKFYELTSLVLKLILLTTLIFKVGDLAVVGHDGVRILSNFTMVSMVATLYMFKSRKADLVFIY